MQKIRANKRLGQHFLTDDNVIANLVSAIDVKKQDNILEIGPGLGALTLPVLQRCGQMSAVEYDRRMIEPLQKKAAPLGKLNLIIADILDFDFTGLLSKADKPEKWRVIGNLPYNLSSAIIFHCLARRSHIADMHFMLQKEVVDRIVALPGSKVYGRLSVMVQMWCETEALFDISATAFSPPPKVNSAVVRLIPRLNPTWEVQKFSLFDRIVRAAFSQRRKMIRKSLGSWFSVSELVQLDIDPTARPENLSGSTFAELSNALYRKEMSL